MKVIPFWILDFGFWIGKPFLRKSRDAIYRVCTSSVNPSVAFSFQIGVKFLFTPIAIISIATINLTNLPVWAVNLGKTPDSSLIPANTLAHYDIDELEGVEKRIRANPNDADAYLHRAMIRSHSQEDFAGAIEDFNKVIQLDPNRAEAYNYRGTSHFWLKDYQKAMADYNQAIRLDPNLAIAYYNRAYVRLEMGDKQGAIADFRQGATLSKKEGDMMSYEQAQQMIQDLQ